MEAVLNVPDTNTVCTVGGKMGRHLAQQGIFYIIKKLGDTQRQLFAGAVSVGRQAVNAI